MSHIPPATRFPEGAAAEVAEESVLELEKDPQPLGGSEDDRPEKAVLPLETGLILSQEPVEIMEKHPAEDGPLQTSGTAESHHGEKRAARNEPTSWR